MISQFVFVILLFLICYTFVLIFAQFFERLQEGFSCSLELKVGFFSTFLSFFVEPGVRGFFSGVESSSDRFFYLSLVFFS